MKPRFATDIHESIIAPDRLEARMGTQEFADGFPTKATARAVHGRTGSRRCP